MRGRALLLLSLLLIAGAVVGQDRVLAQASREASLQARQSDLEALGRQIAENRREIARLRQEGEQIEQLLAAMERERVAVERYVRTLGAQEKELVGDIEQRRAALTELEEAIKQKRRWLAAALVHFYREERVTAAELLVSSKSFGEIFARAHYWGRTVHRLREQVLAVDAQQRELQTGLGEVERRRRQVLALRRAREEEVARMRREEEERHRYRAQLSETIQRHEEQTRKLTASQEKIVRLIAEAQRSAAAVGAGLAAERGSLAWPVRGRVVRGYGTVVHPKYGTRVRHKGIVITADEGTPIRAVAAGRVVFVGWLEGYGRTVILDHGQGWFSIYAHASETLVGQEDQVRGGEEIARVGSTDSLEGSGLHFEIRQGSEALDPAGFLAGGGGR